MTISIAKTKHVKVSPRKARLVAKMIRGKTAAEALLQLGHSDLKSGRLLLKTLVSAIANAENNNNSDRESLYVSEVRIDEGTFHKRSWARSRGKRSMILKRTSHFTIGLDSISNKVKEK